MQLSPSDLALIKSQPQEFNLFLNIYQPETIFAAQVSDNISQNERDIPFGAITTGTPAAIQDNFIMMVGTTPGGNNRGTIRTRFVSGTHIVVAENSNIQWHSGQYITVLNYIDIDAVYPRIIQKPGNPEDVIFLKDYDIVYTNQNSILGTFVDMGPHRATFRDPATGLSQLYWTSTGTYNVNGKSLTYKWFFEGATITGSTAATPGWITYDHAGDFRTSLEVTSSEGAVDISYRFVSIRDRPDAGPNRPITQWEINSMQGSRTEAGYTARVKIWEPVDDINYLKDGALIVVFSDDYYAGTRKNLGGNAENCSEIFFVGYILKGSINYDYKQGTVEFDIGSVTEMMKMSQGFSVSCQDDRNPNTWFKIKDMTVPKAIYHYLRWHSTVLLTTDFQYTEDNRIVQYFDSDRESLYDAVARFVETGIKGEMVCDRQGKIWTELSAAGQNNGRTSFPLSMSISKNDWGSSPPSNAGTNAARAEGTANSPSITERVFPEMSYLEYGGIFYNSTGSSLALLSCAPGDTPSYKGGIDQVEGFILTSQAQLNRLVGNVFAYENSRFPEVTFSMAGAYKNMDIAPIEMAQLNMDATDTPRGIVFVNEPFHITAVEWEYRPSTKSLIQVPHFAQLTNGTNGVTIPVPKPPKGGNNVPGTKVPPVQFSFPVPTGTAFQAAYGLYSYFNAGGEQQREEHNVLIVGSGDVISMTPGFPGIYLVMAHTLSGDPAGNPSTINVGVNITIDGMAFSPGDTMFYDFVSFDDTLNMMVGEKWSGLIRIPSTSGTLPNITFSTVNVPSPNVYYYILKVAD